MNKLEEKWANDWNTMFQLCQEYKKQYGDIDIPKRYVIIRNNHKYNLGRWLCSQREMYFGKGKRKYNQEHINKLNELGMIWFVDYNKNNISFAEMAINFYVSKYFDTCKYKKNNIEIDIYIKDKNIGIEYDGCAWHNIDKDLKKNKYCLNNNITLYRIREIGCDELNSFSIDYYYDRNKLEELEKAILWLLNNIGITNCDVNIKRDSNIIYDLQKNGLTQPWKDKYAICKQYYEEYGNINFSTSTIINGVKIGCWLNEQRKLYKKNKLSNEKIKLLELLNIVWGDVDEYNWNKKYNLLIEYKELYGTANPPNKTVFKNTNIGDFANKERQKYFQKSKGKYNQEHVDKLNEIGFIWNIMDKQWLDKYYIAKEYYNKYGHINIPYDTIIDGIKIGIWISRQRNSYKKLNTNNANPNFTNEKIKLLEELNISWK